MSSSSVAEVKELETVTAKYEGKTVELRTFSLSLNGITVQLSTVGASIDRILVPNYKFPDKVDDICLGYKSPAAMLESGNPPYFGAIVGRVANRIAQGKFSISQGSYELEINNSPNHLHGGVRGFSHCIWNAEIVSEGVRFSLTSHDGDQGYPGTVLVTATYTLVSTSSQGATALRLVMNAKLLDDDKNTPIGLSQHSYFNLASHKDPNGVLHHRVSLPSEAYTPVDENLIPTRQVRSLDQDPAMDWRGEGRLVQEALVQYGIVKAGLTDTDSKKNIGRSRIAPDIATTGNKSPYGFDHNYVVKRSVCDGLNLAGIVTHEETNRCMTVWTDAAGVQLYTANFLDGMSLDSSDCKDGAAYGQWQGLCLETQSFPDSINVNEDDFPEFSKGKCYILHPDGPDYKHTVEYRFEPMS